MFPTGNQAHTMFAHALNSRIQPVTRMLGAQRPSTEGWFSRVQNNNCPGVHPRLFHPPLCQTKLLLLLQTITVTIQLTIPILLLLLILSSEIIGMTPESFTPVVLLPNAAASRRVARYRSLSEMHKRLDTCCTPSARAFQLQSSSRARSLQPLIRCSESLSSHQ